MLSDRDYMREDPRGRQPSGMPRLRAVTWLIIICSVAFVIQESTVRVSTSYTNEFIRPVNGLGSYTFLTISLLKDKSEVWRLVTYQFAHGGIGHLFLNMWALFMFGRPVEDRIGRRRFLLLYFLSGVAGALIWMAANLMHPEAFKLPLVGASAAVMGVIAAAAFLYPKSRVLLLIPPMVVKLRTLAIIIVASDVILYLANFNLQIAHEAHIGGFVLGFLFIRFLTTGWPLRSSPSKVRRRAATARGTLRPDLRFVDPPESADESSDPNADRVMSSDIDPILDKIGREGMDSLTKAEKDILERARKAMRRR